VILVVGSTGMLGGEVCRLLLEQGQPVRALVRESSGAATVDRLRQMGADVVYGDLREPQSLADACAGANAVLSTATAMRPGNPGEWVLGIDRTGQQALATAAQSAGVDHFVYVSISGNLEVPVMPLQEAKRAVEQQLQRSSMGWTILRPSAFMEVWLSPLLGFDPPNGRATVYGSGGAPISYISVSDVARFCVESLSNPAARNQTIEIGGPDAMTPLQVVRVAEGVTGRRIQVQHVPEEALQAQFDSAPDPLQKSFAGLMLALAAGDVIDMRSTLLLFPLTLRSVRHHIETTFGKGATPEQVVTT
jgi:uncharacterized protein YbjT (DUF2867 family)